MRGALNGKQATEATCVVRLQMLPGSASQHQSRQAPASLQRLPSLQSQQRQQVWQECCQQAWHLNAGSNSPLCGADAVICARLSLPSSTRISRLLLPCSACHLCSHSNDSNSCGKRVVSKAPQRIASADFHEHCVSIPIDQQEELCWSSVKKDFQDIAGGLAAMACLLTVQLQDQPVLVQRRRINHITKSRYLPEVKCQSHTMHPHLIRNRLLDGRLGQKLLCLQLFCVQTLAPCLLFQQLLPPALLALSRQLLFDLLHLSLFSADKTVT